MQNIITTSPLVWAGLLAGMVMLPILIHLINRLRHKRVRWAAMDFLLASHKKNQNRVWLKQLLLLLARITCLVLLLLTLGQVGCDNDSMTRILGGKITHHYILVDDSLSMSDTTAGQTALDRARKSMGLIASRIAGRDRHRVTVLRFSQAAQTIDSGIELATGASEVALPLSDLNSFVVDRDIERVMSDVTARLEITSLATGPDTALELASNLVRQRADENAVIYLLSDFRKGDWASSGSMSQSFTELANAGAAVELIRCVDAVNENLAITFFQPDGSVRVAGIPLMMELQITNFGSQPARKLQISLQSATYPDDSADDVTAASIEPELNELPTILIDEIAAGETGTRRFPVFFPKPGQHAIRATLQPDALPGDDARWVVTRFSTTEKVLVIDGPSSQDGKFLSLAMAPGGMTGLQVEQTDKSILRDADAKKLDEYEAIFLLDVDRLEEAAVQHLRAYIERGGGVVYFAGPNTNLKHYTSTLYADGNGIYPLPLERATAVTEQLEEQTADIVPTRHPVFAAVLDVDYSPLDLVQIKRVCQPPLEWSAASENSVNILATVRGDARLPLVVEKKLGMGSIVAVLTSAGPQWNNWLRNPTFPTTLLLTQDYVSRGRNETRRQLTGMRKQFELPASKFRPDIEFVSPLVGATGLGFDRTRWAVTATKVANDDLMIASLGNSISETSQPGIYESWIMTNTSDRQLDRFALNVSNDESQLKMADTSELKEIAREARIVNWDKFGPGSGSNRGTSLVRIILVLLLVGLIAEQLLAYSASYHPRASKRPDIHSNRRSQPSRSTGTRAA